LHQIILNIDVVIGEQIKWKSPSFYYAGEMKAFDPKEYKRDNLVVNIHKGIVLLVFPTGTIVKDGFRLLKGDYKDGKCGLNFIINPMWR